MFRRSLFILPLLAIGLAAQCGERTNYANLKLAEGYFITPAELNELQNNPEKSAKLVIIDTRAAKHYKQFHIPHAVNLPKTILRSDEDLAHKRNTGFAIKKEKAEKLFSGLGVSNDSIVVAYDSISYPDATIVWSLLTYYGHKNAMVLSGGFEGWVKANQKITAARSKVKPGKFVAKEQPHMVVTADWLNQNLDDVTVLDMRTLSEYLGINSAGNERGGSIPGAIHVEWSELAGQSTLKTTAEIAAVLKKYEITNDKPIVTYCNFGIGRSTYGFMLLKALQFKDVRVYGGSMEDWAERQELPVADTRNIPKN